MPKPTDDEEGPERTCIVTRRKGDPDAMIRFVLGPDGAVVPDIRRKLPGRGVWVSANKATVAEAVKRQAFTRGFKTRAGVPPTLADDIEALLTRDCLQALSMANKAGIVVAGYTKVEAAITSGKVACLLHASDAGVDGIRKIEGLARRHAAPGSDAAMRSDEAICPVSIKLFRSEQLDLALGRTNVIHASLAAGPASKAFMARCRRLGIYRSEALPEVGAVAEAEPA